MKFDIIKNSESNTGYAIADCEYMGQTCHLNGWQFEVANASGEVGYTSVYYTYLEPEAYIKGNSSDYLRWSIGLNGFTFTGRVIFRGYFEDYEELWEGKWEQFVREVPFDMADLLYEEPEEELYDDQYDYLYDMA